MIGLPFGKQTRGKQELLKLLQDGKIQAVFDFPSAARPRISIPAEFWLDIQSGHFQKLLTWSKKSERYRQFLVEPVKFIGQYAALFGESYFGGTVSMEARAVAFAELESALAKVNRKKEAYILESEWARAARTGLQSDPRHEHHGCPTAHGGDDGIVSIRIINAPTTATSLCRLSPGVSTQPRPTADTCSTELLLRKMISQLHFAVCQSLL